METVVSPPVEPELNLLTTWGEPDDAPRRRNAAIATALLHIVAITTLFLLPESFFQSKPLPDAVVNITPLFEPLTPLTQKAPNPSKTPKEFSAEERGMHRRFTQPAAPAPAAPPAPAPQPAVAAARPAPTPAPPAPAPKKAEIPPTPTAKPQQTPATPEPPKVDATANVPKVDLPQISTLPGPPPKIETQEQPKLALQNLSQGPPRTVPPDQRRVPLPDTTVGGAIQHSIQEGSPRPPAAPGGESQNMQLPQLLSDSQGVDFTNYLRRILQMVKRNWQSVIPTESRYGRPGKVSIVLSIARTGRIVKMVYAQQSGASLPDAYDKAAVQGISMTQEEGFPPFPADFKGDQIVVQFNFAYNAPRQ